jgi:hypothetical protein
MSTKNGGKSVKVRGAPGGVWHLYPDGFGSSHDGSYFCTWPENSSLFSFEGFLSSLSDF